MCVALHRKGRKERKAEAHFENKFIILYIIYYKEQTITIEAVKHKDEV
jgi:hypothetical protein